MGHFTCIDFRLTLPNNRHMSNYINFTSNFVFPFHVKTQREMFVKLEMLPTQTTSRPFCFK